MAAAWVEGVVAAAVVVEDALDASLVVVVVEMATTLGALADRALLPGTKSFLGRPLLVKPRPRARTLSFPSSISIKTCEVDVLS